VGYPILKLSDYCSGPKQYVRKLEEVLIHTLLQWGIEGYRLEKKPGVWVRWNQADAKIAAIGVRQRLRRLESGLTMGSRFTDLPSTSILIYLLFPISCPAAWHSALSHPWPRSGSPPYRPRLLRYRSRGNLRKYSTFNGRVPRQTSWGRSMTVTALHQRPR